jgi:hypothetical protein
MAAAADSPIIYEVFLDAKGNPADPAVASMRVTVTGLDMATAAEVDRERRSLARGGDHWCQGTISPEYIADQVPELNYIMRLEAVDQRGAPHRGTMQIGFATLINQGDGSLYIDVICAKVTDIAKRLAGITKVRAGTLMLSQIAAFGRDNGYNKLRLSSLAYVIGYYQKFGFRLDAKASRRHTQIMEDIKGFRFASDEAFEMAYLVGYAISLTGHMGQESMSRGELTALESELTRLFSHWEDDDPFVFVLKPGTAGIDVSGGDDDERDELQKIIDASITHPEKAVRLVDTVLALRKEGLSKADRRKNVTRRHAVQREDGGRMAAAAAEHGFSMVYYIPGARGGKRRTHTQRRARAARKQTRKSKRGKGGMRRRAGRTVRRRRGPSFRP